MRFEGRRGPCPGPWGDEGRPGVIQGGLRSRAAGRWRVGTAAQIREQGIGGFPDGSKLSVDFLKPIGALGRSARRRLWRENWKARLRS